MKPIFILIPVFNTAYQIFIKLAANDMTPWLWLALASEILAFMLWMQVLAAHDLSKAFPLSAISYVLILGSGWLLFHEDIIPMQIIGSMLIMGGIWLIGTTQKGKNS